jgi:DNA-binding NarL/FixJ family response regulator
MATSISEKTVKAHLKNIFRKLKLDSRVTLGILAQSRQPKS